MNAIILTTFINSIPNDQRLGCAIVLFVFAGVCLLAVGYCIKEMINDYKEYKNYEKSKIR